MRTLGGRVVTYGTLSDTGRNFSGIRRLRGLMGASSGLRGRFVLHSGTLLNCLSKHCAGRRGLEVLVRTVKSMYSG